MSSDQLKEYLVKYRLYVVGRIFLWSNGSNIKASAVMRYALSIYNGRMEVTWWINMGIMSIIDDSGWL